MFGIGFSELIIIALVIIIVIRPSDMPAFFRKLGHLYAQAKKMFKDVAAVKDNFLREMDITAAMQDAGKPRDASKTESSGQDLKSKEKPVLDGIDADMPSQSSQAQDLLDAQRAEESQRE
ncbi:MAG TPA: hypothetical protein DIT55_08910 [Spirochaetaceae bacterium]|nr:hypothetical protein [Spirochaetaceae bacterium]